VTGVAEVPQGIMWITVVRPSGEHSSGAWPTKVCDPRCAVAPGPTLAGPLIAMTQQTPSGVWPEGHASVVVGGGMVVGGRGVSVGVSGWGAGVVLMEETISH